MLWVPRVDRRSERWGCGLVWLLSASMVAGGASAQQPAPLAAPPQASAAAPLVFRDVTVIDVRDGRRLPNQMVVVIGSRIRSIEPMRRARVPVGGRVVNARGKYLIPGLWDMHVHPMKYIDIAYPLLLSNGVTGVRDAGSSVPLATLGQWKREVAAGTRIGPRHLVSGPSIHEAPDGIKTIQEDKALPHSLWVPRALARWVVDSLHAAGADFIKTYNMSPEMYFEVAAAARHVGLPFGGHIREEQGPAFDGREASDSGAIFLDHHPYFRGDPCGVWAPDSVDPSRCGAAAQHLRRNRTWVTLSGWPSIRVRGESSEAETARWERFRRYLPRSVRRIQDSVRIAGGGPPVDTSVTALEPTSTANWMMRPEPLRTYSSLHAADVPLLLGTDALVSPIHNMFASFIRAFVRPQEGLVALVLGGWTPPEVLRMATLDAAQALGGTDSLGTVETDKLADLVLLDADPLNDIWNTTRIHAVVANGRYYDRVMLNRLLVQAEAAAALH